MAPVLTAQNPQTAPAAPTFHLNSTLVFLDVTVLDKHGHPVVSGLTKDDFTITEDKKPQRIFPFEGPQTHTLNVAAGDENPDGRVPVTILVLDQAMGSIHLLRFYSPLNRNSIRWLRIPKFRVFCPALREPAHAWRKGEKVRLDAVVVRALELEHTFLHIFAHALLVLRHHRVVLVQVRQSLYRDHYQVRVVRRTPVVCW